MKPFDIFIAFVSWESSGKYRPVLIIYQQESIVFAFKITTQYESKSDAIRTNCFVINDWQKAGLDSPSYVDTNTILDIPAKVFEGKTEIGRLTTADEHRLIEFISP